MKKILIIVLTVLLILWIGLIIVNQSSSPAAKLGVANGELAACPDSPNCVNTFATSEQHAIQPIEFAGSSEEAMQAILAALQSMPRIQIEEEQTNYVRATATTLLMRYIDDVEVLFDEATKQIHFRSASRIGYSDLGANRARMELFRERFSASTND